MLRKLGCQFKSRHKSERRGRNRWE